MATGGGVRWLRDLDAFPKLGEEFRVRTTHGAIASIVAIIAMTYLFISELSFYRRIDVVGLPPLANAGNRDAFDGNECCMAWMDWMARLGCSCERGGGCSACVDGPRVSFPRTVSHGLANVLSLST